MAPPGASVAAPCCATGDAPGFEQLASWEDRAFGLRLGMTESVGQWDAEGVWRGDEGRWSERTTRAELYGLIRLATPVSAELHLLVLWTQRTAGELEGQDVGLGEPNAGVRYALTEVGAGAWPGLALTAGVTLPLGRAPDESETPLGTDVTGRGQWIPAAGVSVQESWTPWFARVDAALSVPLEGDRGGHRRGEAPGWFIGTLAGRDLDDEWAATLTLNLRRGGSKSLDGEKLPDSATSDTTVGASVGWKFSATLLAQFAVDAPLPFDGLGVNHPTGPGFTVGLRDGDMW